MAMSLQIFSDSYFSQHQMVQSLSTESSVKSHTQKKLKISGCDFPLLSPVLFAMACPTVFVVPDARILQGHQQLGSFQQLAKIQPVHVPQQNVQDEHVFQNCLVLPFV
jgi:hypothetical protein